MQGQLTCVAAVSGEEARDGLETRHQEVLRKQVEGRLQGWVWLQGVLQATGLHQRQVLVLWRGSTRHGTKPMVFPVKEPKPRNLRENVTSKNFMSTRLVSLRSGESTCDVRHVAHNCILSAGNHMQEESEFQARPSRMQQALSQRKKKNQE